MNSSQTLCLLLLLLIVRHPMSDGGFWLIQQGDSDWDSDQQGVLIHTIKKGCVDSASGWLSQAHEI